MGRLITDTFNFAAVTEPEWPEAGSFIVGFDSADNQLKKLDSFGVLTPIGGGNLADTLDTGRDVDVSGIINTFSSQAAIDVNTRLLIGTGSLNSIDWENRNLFDAAGNLVVEYNTGWLVDPTNGWATVQWIANTLNDTPTSGLSLDWNTRVLYQSDGSTTSLDWENKHLLSGGIALNWSNRSLYDIGANITVDWSNMFLYSTSNPGAQVNWGAGFISDTLAFPTMDFYNRVLYDGAANNSINWNSRELYDSSGQIVLIWEQMQAINPLYGGVINWGSGVLGELTGAVTTSVDWANRQLVDSFASGSLLSLDWQNRVLYDSQAIPVNSINWGSRELIDDLGFPALRWDITIGGRRLYNTLGQLVYDWENLTHYIPATGEFSIIGRSLIASGNFTSLDWEAHTLQSGGLALDWTTRILHDIASALPSINWDTRVAYYSDGISPSINWSASILFDGGGGSSINWESKILNDSSGILAVNWNGSAPGERILFADNSGATISVNWQGRLLNDVAELPSLNWASRSLMTSGGVITFDWENILANDFANDAAAAVGGIPVGGIYHTSGTLKIRLV